MKSKDRVKGYKEGTQDWNAEYNMLLDDGVTCNECAHVEKCCALFGQRPYVNSGRCQFYPNRFKLPAPPEVPDAARGEV
jgi:hypothetical protein